MILMQEPQIEEGVVPKIEWKEGDVCPVVTNRDEFAKVNKQIVQEIEEQEEISEEGLEHEGGYRLPGNIIE